MFEAWGDESGSDHVLDPGTYLMAAALVDPAHGDVIREQMRTLSRPGYRKIHWREEDDKRQLALVGLISDLPLEAIVVVRTGARTDHQEHRRRKVLERLFPRLVDLGCGRVVLESRGRKDDDRDHEMLDHMRRRRLMPGPLRLEHMPGPADVLLAVPDVVCGAVVAARCGDARFLTAIERRVSVVPVDAC